LGKFLKIRKKFKVGERKIFTLPSTGGGEGEKGRIGEGWGMESWKQEKGFPIKGLSNRGRGGNITHFHSSQLK
jgi:hypothetical protein